MARGRSAELQRLFDLAVGESMELRPEIGTSIDTLAKRLKQVITLYLRQGRAYRLEVGHDHVEAFRVSIGSHRKLSYLTDLSVGERWFAGETLSWPEKKALLARVHNMNRDPTKNGIWFTEVDPGGIWVRRCSNRATGEVWNDDGALPTPPPLTLHRE